MATNRKRMKRKLRKTVRKVSSALNKVMTAFSVIVIVLGCAYFAIEIHANISINKVSDQVKETYHQAVEKTEQMQSIIPTNIAAAAENDAGTELAPAITAAPVVTQAPAANTNVPAIAAAASMFQMDMAADVAAEKVEPEYVFQEQFADLFHQNDDMIGWISVNENIEYPIVYRDNEFYMNHDFNGKKNQAGWIFLDQRNDMNFTDDNLLIYGHNMRSGSMFGDLDFYRKYNYLAERPVIEIQSIWNSEVKQYVIFSMFDASMNKGDSSYIKITNFNFDTPDAKQDYIDELLSRSLMKLPVDVNANDQLVTLVTCSYSHNNGRFLMFARELREGETEAGMLKLFADAK